MMLATGTRDNVSICLEHKDFLPKAFCSRQALACGPVQADLMLFLIPFDVSP